MERKIQGTVIWAEYDRRSRSRDTYAACREQYTLEKCDHGVLGQYPAGTGTDQYPCQKYVRTGRDTMWKRETSSVLRWSLPWWQKGKKNDILKLLHKIFEERFRMPGEKYA